MGSALRDIGKLMLHNDLRVNGCGGWHLAFVESEAGDVWPRVATIIGMLTRSRQTPMQRAPKKGFTLIELLIVVVIIGILAAVAIPKFSYTKQRASRAAGLADMRNLSTSQEGFFADSSRYAAIADTGSGSGKMNFTPSTGNTGLTLVASTTGWSGVMNIPGSQKCGVYHGSAAVPAGMPATTQSGTAVCW